MKSYTKKILSWPYIKTKKEFDEYYQEFESFFTAKATYEISLNQTKQLYQIKEKWSIV